MPPIPFDRTIHSERERWLQHGSLAQQLIELRLCAVPVDPFGKHRVRIVYCVTKALNIVACNRGALSGIAGDREADE